MFTVFGVTIVLYFNATHIMENSSTLIHHHYSTHLEHVLTILLPAFGLSDHNPTVLTRIQNANLKVAKQCN